jgi:hypothetical protein
MKAKPAPYLNSLRSSAMLTVCLNLKLSKERQTGVRKVIQQSLKTYNLAHAARLRKAPEAQAPILPLIIN